VKVLSNCFRQSASGLGGSTIATNSPARPGSAVIGLAEALRLAPDIGIGLPSPGGVPGMETDSPSLGKPSGRRARVFSSSQIEDLNRSCMNTPGGVIRDLI
jgi:hypothetical protein